MLPSGDAEPVAIELLNYRKDGTAFWNAMTITPVRDEAGVAYYYAAQADMTHAHQLEASMRGTNDELERLVDARTHDLSAALEQKTALLHEVDHRVKNNLQVISSLMLLKARRTPEGDAREALQSMADRIGALSTAHRLLYSEGDCTHFNLGEFAAEFLSDMNAGLDPERQRIEADVEPIAVAAAMAAPLALMIHELTANALRHAFPDAREGRVSIVARRTESGMRLTIRDDGIGIAAASPNPAGFGRNLVEMVVRQLRGTIVVVGCRPRHRCRDRHAAPAAGLSYRPGRFKLTASSAVAKPRTESAWGPGTPQRQPRFASSWSRTRR